MAEQNPPVVGVYQNVYTATSDVTVQNTTTESTLFSGQMNSVDGGLTIPANSLWPGRTYQATIRGIYSTFAILPGDLTIRVKIGGTTVATGVATSALLGSVTNRGFLISFTMTARTLGTTGTVQVAGDVALNSAANSRLFYEINAATAATVNTTVDQPINVTAQWAAANANNKIIAQTAAVSRLL